jgi:adenylate cyclase
LSYGKKLLLTFLTLALVTNSISMGVMYGFSHWYMFGGYQAKMRSIAASVAATLDGDKLKSIRSRADETTPAYRDLHNTLRLVRDANRRSDTYMKRIFTVMKSPDDPSILLITVDPEESLTNASHPGDVYRSLSASALDFTKPNAESAYTTDEFGKFLRSSAPVRDQSGQVIGAVIVEAPEAWVKSVMRPIFFSGLGSLVLAAFLAFPAARFASGRASRPLSQLLHAVEAIGKGEFSVRLDGQADDEFGSVARAVNNMAVGLGERDRVKSAFARYVSQQVLDSVLKSGSGGAVLAGDRRRISVLFCDIRGFSTLSEKLPPERVVQVLNEYFEHMVDVVFRNQGTLDKFIGDGMMVIFGAPEDDAYQEEHALRTALEMQRELRQLSSKWESEGICIRVGIGINSGPAVVGNIGSTKRMEYTAIGDTVNLASRLESATKDLGVPILISEYTYNAVRGSFQMRPMGPVTVRGRSEAVMTYALEDPDLAVPPAEPALVTAQAS